MLSAATVMAGIIAGGIAAFWSWKRGQISAVKYRANKKVKAKDQP